MAIVVADLTQWTSNPDHEQERTGASEWEESLEWTMGGRSCPIGAGAGFLCLNECSTSICLLANFPHQLAIQLVGEDISTKYAQQVFHLVEASIGSRQ